MMTHIKKKKVHILITYLHIFFFLSSLYRTKKKIKLDLKILERNVHNSIQEWIEKSNDPTYLTHFSSGSTFTVGTIAPFFRA